jgi:hypothetical protein
MKYPLGLMYLWMFWFITPDFRFVSKYILTQETTFCIEFTESHNTALCSKITLNMAFTNRIEGRFV